MPCVNLAKQLASESEESDKSQYSPQKPRTPRVESQRPSSHKWHFGSESKGLPPLRRSKTPSSYSSTPSSSASSTPSWSTPPRDPARGRPRIVHIASPLHPDDPQKDKIAPSILAKLAALPNVEVVVCFQQILLEDVAPGCPSDGHILRVDQQCREHECACKRGCRGKRCPICKRDLAPSRRGLGFVEYSPGVLIHKVYGDEE